MHLGDFHNMDSAYYRLLEAVTDLGSPYMPRGKRTVEVRPASFSIDDPAYALYRGKARRLNYAFFAAETLGYMAGLGPVEQARLLLPINPKMEFAVNPETGGLDGAYGPFIGPRLQLIVQQLKEDPETRQAIIPIWHRDVDLASRDVPCTLCLQFFRERYRGMNIQQPVLSLHVSMRSNDLNWGLPYDVAAFCAIQLAVAMALGWNIGNYYHTAGSLHYYLNVEGQEEVPPAVLAPHQGEFHINDALRVPIPYGLRIDQTRLIAIRLCQELLEHQGRLSRFDSQCYADAVRQDQVSEIAYISHWLHLLKGTWRHTPLRG